MNLSIKIYSSASCSLQEMRTLRKGPLSNIEDIRNILNIISTKGLEPTTQPQPNLSLRNKIERRSQLLRKGLLLLRKRLSLLNQLCEPYDTLLGTKVPGSTFWVEYR